MLVYGILVYPYLVCIFFSKLPFDLRDSAHSLESNCLFPVPQIMLSVVGIYSFPANCYRLKSYESEKYCLLLVGMEQKRNYTFQYEFLITLLYEQSSDLRI